MALPSDGAHPVIPECFTELQGPYDSESPTPLSILDIKLEDTDEGPNNPASTGQTRTLTGPQLVLMTFFCTTGGPFGIESAVAAGGPMYAMLGIALIILIWSLPQALMSAELSLMMNENGGCVIWVQHAFGDFVGYVNAHANLLNSLASQAILIVLFVQYIEMATPLTQFEDWGCRIVFSVIVAFMNIWGMEWISRISLLLLAIIFAPFVCQIGVEAAQMTVEWKELFEFPHFGDVHWGLLISTIVWANGGYDSMGSLAGEVKEGSNTYLLGLLGALPIVLINYLAPIVISYLAYPHWKLWDANYFLWISYHAIHVSNDWLGKFMVSATVLSSLAQLNAGIAPTARSVWAMAIGREGGLGEHRYLPFFLSYSYTRENGEILPVVAIIFCSLVSLAISALSLNFIMQFYLIIRLVNLFSEYGALIYLRFKEPNRTRPYSVPGGKIGSIILFLPTLSVSILVLATADPPVIYTGMGATVIIVLSYSVKKFWIWWKYRISIQTQIGPSFY